MCRRGTGDIDQAREAAQDAVEVAIAQRDQVRVGYCLLELGTVQRVSGRLNDALDSFRRSATLQHRTGIEVREAQAWDGEGEVQRELGHLAEAIRLHEKAVDVFRSLDARWLLVVALRNLAAACSAAGQASQAREQVGEAMRLLTEFSDPEARQLEEELRELM
jgi:tetratricopeptide (TPR) repeat protein